MVFRSQNKFKFRNVVLFCGGREPENLNITRNLRDTLILQLSLIFQNRGFKVSRKKSVAKIVWFKVLQAACVAGVKGQAKEV